MTLKFKMKGEEDARKMKKDLIAQAEMFGFITLADVKDQCGQPVEMTFTGSDDNKWGWRYLDLKGRNIMVRQVKRTWYLYLADPSLNVNDISKKQDDYCPPENPPVEKSEEKSDFSEEMIFVDYLVTCAKDMLEDLFASVEQQSKPDPHANHRKCMVIFKRGDDTIKKPAWFHEYEQQSHPSRSGQGWIQQKLAIVEYMDGSTGEVKPHSIRWEDWD